MMIRLAFAPAVLLFAFALSACPGEVEDPDGGGGGLDSSQPDLGSRDVYDGGARDRGEVEGDAEPAEAGEDGGIIIDAGEPEFGESCSTAGVWRGNGVPFTGNTTVSAHREQLSCAGSGGAANAPEVWWKLSLPERQSVVLQLGTDRWDGVLGVRTGTCTVDVETCADRPTTIELPSVDGELFVAVDGFSTGQGFYALSATIDEPWLLPPPHNSCAGAEPLNLPGTVRAHDFEGDEAELAPCGLISAVYYTFDTQGGPLSARALPSASHDVELAVLSGCGAEAVACGSSPGRGVAERIDRLALPAGRWIIAAGTRAARPASGSFTLDVAEDAACTRDAECPIGEVCADGLVCAAERGWVRTSTARVEIPDAGRVAIPFVFNGPTSRVKKVRARVAFEHDYPQDLVIELRSPGPSPVSVRLRDRAAYEADVTYGRDRLADGPGQLEDFLLVETATGAWSLVIEDRAIGDRGFVTGVSIGVE